MNKLVISWILAIIITLSAAIYQRMTGPTYPQKASFTLNEKQYKVKLIRSHGGTSDAPVELSISDNISGRIHYRHYPSDEEWMVVDMNNTNSKLTGKLPNQPPAGKLQYYIELSHNGQTIFLAKEKPVVIRYKGEVPGAVLLPHVLLMFFAMLISNLAGILALFNHKRFRSYTFFAFFLLLIGGMILGPVVQKFAFGDYWTGVPFGWDLTDNKTLIAFIAWIIAFVGNLKTERPKLTIMAAIVLFLIYLIPHSMFGSELDRETGEVVQGVAGVVLIINTTRSMSKVEILKALGIEQNRNI